ncbi:MAG: PAS domain S-box protein [Blastocatellia bacterium]|nr:PAS domain S-box protein [Blastocatellia bacterium]
MSDREQLEQELIALRAENLRLQEECSMLRQTVASRSTAAGAEDWGSPLRKAIEQSFEAYFWLQCVRDEQGHIIDFIIADLNQRALNRLKTTREQVVGTRLCETYPLNRNSVHFGQYVQVFETRTPVEAECQGKTQTGVTLWFRYQVLPWANGVLVISRNITKRHQTESLLRERDEQFFRVADNVPGGVYRVIYHADGHVTVPYLSEGCQDLYGVASLEELRTIENIRAMVHPEDREAFLEAKIKARELCTASAIEYRIVQPSGGIRWIRDIGRYWLNEQGECVIDGIDIDITEQKQIEAALQESRERLRLALAGAQMGTWEVDLATGICTFDELNARLFGLGTEPVTVPPDRFLNCIQPDDRSLMQRQIETELYGGEGVYRIEFRVVHPDGEVRWVSGCAGVVFDAQGLPGKAIGINYDITERKQMEAALRESEAKYRSIIEGSQQGIVITQEWVVRFATDAVAHMLGYQAVADLLGQDCRSWLLPASRDKVEQFAAARKRNESAPSRYEVEVMRHNGALAWFQCMVSQIHWNGQVSQLVTLLDVTEQKQSEEARQRSEERFRALIEHASGGISLLDSRGTVIYGSPNNIRVLGRSVRETVGRSGFDFVHPDDLPRAQADYERLLASPNRPIASHFRMQHVDGSWRWIELIANNLLDNPSVQAVVLNSRDVTEQRLLEEERLKSSKLESLALLAGGIAHDFNNLLMAIWGNVSLARMYAETNARAIAKLETVERACDRAKSLAGQLLTFAKGGDPIRGVTSLQSFVPEAVGFVLAGSNVNCDCQLPLDIWPVNIDTGQIGQAIQNLVLNARDAMPSGGTITIRAENIDLPTPVIPVAPGKYVKILVADTGTGIAPENLAKIFDPYFTTKTTGNGLGLAVVYSIVKKHGGYVTVSSEVNRGTQFDLYIPAVEAPATLPPSSSSGQYQLPVMHHKVLIMDDEEMIRSLMAELLKQLGFEVEPARDGNEAVLCYKMAQEFGRPFHVVILDLMIPGGMGGLDTLAALKQLDPKVKAIVCSGYSTDAVLTDYAAFGFQGQLTKPFIFDELQSVLAEVLQTGSNHLKPG